MNLTHGKDDGQPNRGKPTEVATGATGTVASLVLFLTGHGTVPSLAPAVVGWLSMAYTWLVEHGGVFGLLHDIFHGRD